MINDINYEEIYVSNSACDSIDKGIRNNSVEYSGAMVKSRELRFSSKQSTLAKLNLSGISASENHPSLFNGIKQLTAIKGSYASDQISSFQWSVLSRA